MGSAGVGSAPWVHSGWGIDALLGAQTRTNVVLLDSAGREIDLHPACFAANGDGIYRMKTGEDWPFPAPGFAGRLLDVFSHGFALHEAGDRGASTRSSTSPRAAPAGCLSR